MLSVSLLGPREPYVDVAGGRSEEESWVRDD